MNARLKVTISLSFLKFLFGFYVISLHFLPQLRKCSLFLFRITSNITDLLICFDYSWGSMCFELLKIVNISTFVSVFNLWNVTCGPWLLDSRIFIDWRQFFQVLLSDLLWIRVELELWKFSVNLKVVERFLVQKIIFHGVFTFINSYFDCNFLCLIDNHRMANFHLWSILLSSSFFRFLFSLFVFILWYKFIELFFSLEIFLRHNIFIRWFSKL